MTTTTGGGWRGITDINFPKIANHLVSEWKSIPHHHHYHYHHPHPKDNETHKHTKDSQKRRTSSIYRMAKCIMPSPRGAYSSNIVEQCDSSRRRRGRGIATGNGTIKGSQGPVISPRERLPIPHRVPSSSLFWPPLLSWLVAVGWVVQVGIAVRSEFGSAVVFPVRGPRQKCGRWQSVVVSFFRNKNE